MTNNCRKVTFIILSGRRENACPPADMVRLAREAMVFDLIDKLRSVEAIDRIIISSNDTEFLEKSKILDDRIVPDYFKGGSEFEFGPWLVSRIEKYGIEKAFYWGAGASPFITAEILRSICESIVASENIQFTNNFYSADWTAFTPASAIIGAPPPKRDNNLAYTLWKERQIPSIYCAPTVEIVGDVDTPADLLVLSEHPGIGPNLNKFLESQHLNTDRVKKIAKLLKERNRIFLAGRVGSAIFRYLDLSCLCSFRIVSEERGMRSFGRLEGGEVKSILGSLVECLGIDGLFRFIESVSDAAIIDSRVLFAQVCGNVKTSDRFYSDLGITNKIDQPFVREFTQRVMESSIPILTGGHSLVLGGLWALVWAYGEIPGYNFSVNTSYTSASALDASGMNRR